MIELEEQLLKLWAGEKMSFRGIHKNTLKHMKVQPLTIIPMKGINAPLPQPSPTVSVEHPNL